MFSFGTRARHMSRKLSALVNDEDEDEDDDENGLDERRRHHACTDGTFPLALLFPYVTMVDRTTDFTTASSTDLNVLTERSLERIAQRFT